MENRIDKKTKMETTLQTFAHKRKMATMQKSGISKVSKTQQKQSKIHISGNIYEATKVEKVKTQ